MKKKSLKVGIDLGTVNTLVYVSGRGIIFNEPSVIAFDEKTKKVIAIGNEAKAMVGKTHEKVKVVKPLSDGVISDKEASRAYMGYIIENIVKFEGIDKKNSTVLICCHSDLSTIERDALKDLAQSFGIDDVLVEEEVKAGAIGAGLDIFSANGSMIIDIGGGSTDIGVLALGDLVGSRSIKVAGNHFDIEIQKYVKLKHNYEIGISTAEKIKLNLATLEANLPEEKELTIAGRNLQTGLPSRLVIRQSEIRDLLLKSFNNIVGEVIKVLEQTPPEISADIIENGIVVNGGGALIKGVKEFFEEQLMMDISISSEPLTAIASGTKVLLRNRGNYLVKPHD